MSETLGRVRRRLLKGRVDEARTLLSDAWEQFSRSESETFEFVVGSLKLTILYAWHDLTERFLDEAEQQLRGPGKRGSLPLHVEATIRSARSMFDKARFSTDARELFFDWFLGKARVHPELWTPQFVSEYLYFLAGSSRLTEFDATLRRLPIPLRVFPAFERARLLVSLALRLGNGVHTRKETLVLAAATRKLANFETEVEAAWLRVYSLLSKARAHAILHEPLESQLALKAARPIANRLQSESLFARLDEMSAFTLHRLGRYDEALNAYRSIGHSGEVVARSRHLPFRHRVSAILDWARCAIWCWRFGTAERLLNEADELLDDATPSSLAFLENLRARLELESSAQPRFDIIHRHLQNLEQFIERERKWETRLAAGYHILKGEVACAEGDIRTALRHSKASHRLVSEIKDMAVMDSALYLQSCLLVERALPHASTYDTTRRLAAEVSYPGSRFKVTANLYLYTWSLGNDGLELSDGHLKELAELRELIDEERFQELYRRYVTEPMMNRFQTHLLGG